MSDKVTMTPPQTATAAESEPSQAQAAAPVEAVAVRATAVTQTPVAANAAPTKRISDWVQVQLTDAGREFAGPSGVIHVANGHMQYTFKGTASTRVLRYAEWGKVLSKETFNGQPIFELVPDSAK